MFVHPATPSAYDSIESKVSFQEEELLEHSDPASFLSGKLDELVAPFNLPKQVVEVREGAIRRGRRVAKHTSGLFHFELSPRLQTLLSVCSAGNTIDLSLTPRLGGNIPIKLDKLVERAAKSAETAEEKLKSLYPLTAVVQGAKPNAYVEGMGLVAMAGHFLSGRSPAARQDIVLQSDSGVMQMALFRDGDRLEFPVDVAAQLICQVEDAPIAKPLV